MKHILLTLVFLATGLPGYAQTPQNDFMRIVAQAKNRNPSLSTQQLTREAATIMMNWRVPKGVPGKTSGKLGSKDFTPQEEAALEHIGKYMSNNQVSAPPARTKADGPDWKYVDSTPLRTPSPQKMQLGDLPKLEQTFTKTKKDVDELKELIHNICGGGMGGGFTGRTIVGGGSGMGGTLIPGGSIPGGPGGMQGFGGGMIRSTGDT